MHALMTFPVSAWFPEEYIEPYPYNKTFEEAEWDPLVVLHTSGSTGLPKPIVARQGMLAIADKYHNLGEWKDRRIWVDEMTRRSKRPFHPSKILDITYYSVPPYDITGLLISSLVPLYHAAALYITLFSIHYWDVPAVLGIGDRPLSSDMVLECLKYAEVDSVVLPPVILEELSQSKESINVLKGMAYVGFGGGKRPSPPGDPAIDPCGRC